MSVYIRSVNCVQIVRQVHITGLGAQMVSNLVSAQALYLL